MLAQQQAAHHPFWIGVDVGKDTLSAYVSQDGACQTIANTDAAIRAFLKTYPQAAIVLEATGGYEVRMTTLALGLGHTLYRVNPRRAKAFMESRGIYAKTDAIDAKGLALYGEVNHTELHPFTLPSADNKLLAQLSRRRTELIAMRVQEKNRLQAPDNANLKKSITAVLACLDKQIAALEDHIDALVTASDELNKKVETLTTVKGVGQTTAVRLLAALPELGQLSGKQVASLAGLAPQPRDSGKMKGYRRTGRGRKDARTALYMAALVASRTNPIYKTFYNRLLGNGKKKLQALIAVARKLLVVLNAKLRDLSLQPA